MSQTLQSVLCITNNKYLVRVLVVLLHARFSVVGPIPFLLAAIFFSGHPYIGSTTVLPDSTTVMTKIDAVFPQWIILVDHCYLCCPTKPLCTWTVLITSLRNRQKNIVHPYRYINLLKLCVLTNASAAVCAKRTVLQRCHLGYPCTVNI